MLILKSGKKGPVTKKRGTKQIFRDINTKKYFLKSIYCVKNCIKNCLSYPYQTLSIFY